MEVATWYPLSIPLLVYINCLLTAWGIFVGVYVFAAALIVLLLLVIVPGRRNWRQLVTPLAVAVVASSATYIWVRWELCNVVVWYLD